MPHPAARTTGARVTPTMHLAPGALVQTGTPQARGALTFYTVSVGWQQVVVTRLHVAVSQRASHYRESFHTLIHFQTHVCNIPSQF